MASTKIPVELSSTPGIVDNSNATAITIDSNENVGVGTTTPDEFTLGTTYKYFAVGGTDKTGIINIIDKTTQGSYLQFGTAAGVRRASIHALDGSHLAFNTNTNNSGTSVPEKMRITSAGNVGIGTQNPSQPLHVEGNVRIADAGSIQFGSSFYQTMTGQSGSNDLLYRTYQNHIFKTGTGPSSNTDGTERMRITDGGDVSVGSDHGGFSGWRVLNLRGQSTGALLNYEKDDGTRRAAIANSGSELRLQTFLSGGAITFESGTGTEYVRITGDGNLKFTGKTTNFETPGFTYHTNNYLYLRGGSAGTIISDDSGINTVQIIDGSNGYINFETGDGTSRMRIKHDGKVGIGTPNPAVPLDVQGSAGLFITRTSSGIASYIENNSGYGSLYLYQIGGSPKVQIQANGNSYFDGGNVGIGTTSPASLLSVQGDGFGIRIDGTANTTRGILLRSTGTAEGQIQTDGNMHFIQEDANRYMRFSTGNTERMRIGSDGNISIGGFGGTTTGGSGARWINLDTPSSNTYSSGLLYKINGTIKAYHYVENDFIMHQTTSGVGQKFYAGTDVALTIASNGEINNSSTLAAGVTLNGFINLGKNENGRAGDIVTIRGTGLAHSNGNRYGNYGSLLFTSSANWTGSARKVLLTNGLNANQFGIITGVTSSATTPNITSAYGGGITNGEASFVIDLPTGNIGYRTDSPAFSHHTVGTTAGNNSSGPSGQQHEAIQSTNVPAGGYYEKVRYYQFSGNTDHTLVWGNTDSYFSAMVELWAGCSNGGTRNNMYVRGLWHSNHTSHLWDELERTANVSNGDTFTFTAAAYTSGSTASKLTLFHDYGSASFYYGKVKITVIAGDYSYYNQS